MKTTGFQDRIKPASTLLPVLLVAVPLLLPHPAEGQLVRGTVRSANDGDPIPSARVALLDLVTGITQADRTNGSGRFQLSREIGPANVLEVSALGYLTHIDTIYAGSETDSITLDITLGVEALPLEPLVVVGSRRPVWETTQPKFLWGFFERKRHFGHLGLNSRFYDRAEIHRRVGERGSLDRLIGLMPALPLYRGCRPTYFLDGVRYRYGNPLTETPWGTQDLAGVEIYYGTMGIPAEFITESAFPCMVVAIWTQKPIIPETTETGRFGNNWVFAALGIFGLVLLAF